MKLSKSINSEKKSPIYARLKRNIFFCMFEELIMHDFLFTMENKITN
jgi:hypothetical protein